MGIDYRHEREEYRTGHTSAERAAKARMMIDSGFVHHRKILALLRICIDDCNPSGFFA